MNNLHGHRKMIVWQNIDRLCPIVGRLVKQIPGWNYKLIRQIEAAMDSVGANFVEGYYSGSLPEYLRFLRYSKRSLAEVQERIRRCHQRQYLNPVQYKQFDELSIKTFYLIDRLIYALREKLEKGH
jgi:four helix bundle protein